MISFEDIRDMDVLIKDGCMTEMVVASLLILLGYHPQALMAATVMCGDTGIIQF